MRRLIELAIRRPAVADEDAIELGAEHRRRFVKPAPVFNGVDDGARGRKDPQPPEPSTHFPTGFIRTDDWTAADLFAQRRIGGRRATRGPMQGVRHAAGPHAQPEPVAQQRSDLGVRQAQLFVEQHDQRDRVGPQMRAGGVKGVGGLQGMPPLHASAAVGTAADVDVEAAHVPPHNRQILLNLCGEARLGHPAATVWACRRERHLDRFVDRRGITIEIHTSSYRAVRGYTVVGAVLDELAFWPTDDSANPDTEVLNALRPAMATVPGALLLAISSPYARRGELWRAHEAHFGKDGDPVLVWQAPTLTMHPALDRQVVADAYAEDPAVAGAEYGAEFRSDLERIFTREVLSASSFFAVA